MAFNNKCLAVIPISLRVL